MIDISVHNLTKFFVIGENLLEGLSFEVQEGECVAILGRNGCGKTTLLKILTGEMDYDDGEVFVNPNKRLGLISQIPKFPAGYTVEDVLRCAYQELLSARKKMEKLEQQMAQSASDDLLREYDALVNRFQAGGGYDMDVEVDKVCNGLGITPEQRRQAFDSLSGGEKTRVNLARLLLEKTDILLLDEPTNHLDLRSGEWLESYINAFKGTVLAISHDRFFLDRIAQRVIEIVDGHAEFYSGNYSFYIEEKQARFNLQLKQYEQEQAKLKQLGYTVERMKGWGINNRTLYRRAMSIQHRMERIKKTEKPKTEKTMKATFGEKDFSGDVVFKIKGLSKAFGEHVLFSDVNLNVEGGERIALLGDNGSGKTTFLSCLLGDESCQGKIQFGPTVKGICPRSCILTIRSAACTTPCSMKRTVRPRQPGIGWAHSFFRARMFLRQWGTFPAGSSPGCGFACSWMKRSIFSFWTSQQTIWILLPGNGWKRPLKNLREHCFLYPTTGTLLRSSLNVSGFCRMV